MPLIMMDQVTYFPPIFEPEYEVGSHGEVNPLTGAIYGAFGLTIIDARKRSDALQRLWGSTHTKGAAYKNKQKFAPIPEPDFVEDFPPEDTRGIVAILIFPETLALQFGTAYDLTLEVVLGNKTPTDLVVSLEALDLTPDNGELTLVLNQTNFLLPSASEATVLLAVKIPDTVVGPKTIHVTGTTEPEIMVQPAECVLDLQPINAPTVFYQVDGPDTYFLTVGDPVELQFTSSNGMGELELWEFDDLAFLMAHDLMFDETGLLSSTGVTGPPGVYQVTVFVEQVTDYGAKLFASKIIEILVAESGIGR